MSRRKLLLLGSLAILALLAAAGCPLPLEGGLIRPSAEGIAGSYTACLQGGGSISGSFDVSFVEL